MKIVLRPIGILVLTIQKRVIRNDNPRPKYAIIKNNIFYKCGNAFSFSDSSSTEDYNLFLIQVTRPVMAIMI
jgi:hypothetical protein